MNATIGRLAWIAVPWLAAAEARGAGAADRPNLVLILADDLGYGDLGCTGGKAVPTPHLDALARSGMRFTDFYAASAVCTPTRASILTGRFPLRFDIREHFMDDERHLPRGVVTLPRLLREAGYATAHVGKWHLGGLNRRHAAERGASIPGPREHGFEHYLAQIEEQPLRGQMGAARRLYRDGGTCLLRNDAPVPPEDPYCRMHFTDIIGEEAVRLVKQYHRERRPFFLNLWHLAPHTPYEPGSGEHYRNTAAPGLSEDQHCFRSMVAHLDATVGALVAQLDGLGIRGNTLVLFTSDNGGAWESDNGPFQGGKTDLHEGGIRVPLIVSWPGRIPAGTTSDALSGTVDLLPTLCAAAGVAVPPSARVDGLDLLPHLTRGAAVDPRRVLLWQLDLYPRIQRHAPKPEPYATEAARWGPWKMLARGGEPVALFDLSADPGETKNLLEVRADVAGGMRERLRSFLAEPRDRRGFPESPAGGGRGP
jgi:N-acetylgalactosamine-6-sulfatase